MPVNKDHDSGKTTSRDEEHLFFEIMDSLPDGILLVDSSGTIVRANSEAEHLFGYAPGELTSQSVDVLVPEEFRNVHVPQRKAYFKDPTRRTMGEKELPALRKDQSVFCVFISLSPVRLGDKILACAAVRDMTPFKRVESALHDAEAQIRLLLDSTAEAIYGLDLKKKCTFCNRACVELLGYQCDEDLLGKNMHDLIHHTRVDGSPYPMDECKIYETLRHEVGSHVKDEVFWRADGSSFPAEYRSFPVHRDGKLVGSVVTFLDITEQQQYQKEVRAQRDELTHVARLSTLGEMAAGLAHELNQPLTSMSALAEGALLRLERGKLQQGDFVTVCRRIASDSQRAGDIIRRLRNFVQKRRAERTHVNINQLVGEVLSFVESDLKHEDVAIETKLTDDLPEIEADPIEIQQVLVNLIRNSCDAIIENGSEERKIVVETRVSDDSGIEVIVADSGPGIPQNVIERAFEPFYSSKPHGLGIGLGICNTIIEAHRGRIWIGDLPSEGASVHFKLPPRWQQSDDDEN